MFDFNRDFTFGFAVGAGLIWLLPKVLEYLDEDNKPTRRKKRVKRKIKRK